MSSRASMNLLGLYKKFSEASTFVTSFLPLETSPMAITVALHGAEPDGSLTADTAETGAPPIIGGHKAFKAQRIHPPSWRLGEVGSSSLARLNPSGRSSSLTDFISIIHSELEKRLTRSVSSSADARWPILEGICLYEALCVVPMSDLVPFHCRKQLGKNRHNFAFCAVCLRYSNAVRISYVGTDNVLKGTQRTI